MADDYRNIHKNLRSVRRSDFNVYDPIERVNAWTVIRRVVIAVIIIGIILSIVSCTCGMTPLH
jgi:hypothetical protein